MTVACIPYETPHWSIRLMAKVAKITTWQVCQIGNAADLKPHRLKNFKISNAPNLSAWKNPFSCCQSRYIGTVFLPMAVAPEDQEQFGKKKQQLSLNFLRIRRILCPAPQNRVLILAPNSPNRSLRPSLRSVYICANTSSTALRFFSSFFICGVIPRLRPEINTSGPLMCGQETMVDEATFTG